MGWEGNHWAMVPHGRGFSLLCRATNKEYSAANFHVACDPHSPTLMIVKCEEGNIFGGFTITAWNSADGAYVSDDKAFLFTLSGWSMASLRSAGNLEGHLKRPTKHQIIETKRNFPFSLLFLSPSLRLSHNDN